MTTLATRAATWKNPPDAMYWRRPMTKIQIEFHNTCPSLGVRLWQLIPTAWLRTKDAKAWKATIKEVQWIVRSRIHVYGYTSYRWVEQFDRTFIIPLKDDQKIEIHKKYNENYEEDRANLEKFKTDMEALLVVDVPRIYEENLIKSK